MLKTKSESSSRLVVGVGRACPILYSFQEEIHLTVESRSLHFISVNHPHTLFQVIVDAISSLFTQILVKCKNKK